MMAQAQPEQVHQQAFFNSTDVTHMFKAIGLSQSMQLAVSNLLRILNKAESTLIDLAVPNATTAYTAAAIVVTTRNIAEEGSGVVCPSQLTIAQLLTAANLHFCDLMLALDSCLKLLPAIDAGHLIPTPLLPELGRYVEEQRRIYSVSMVLKQRLDRWLGWFCMDQQAPDTLRLRQFVWLTFLAAKTNRLKQALYTHTQALLYLLVCVLHFACVHCKAELLKEAPRSAINDQGVDITVEHPRGLAFLTQRLRLEIDEVNVIYKCFWKPFLLLNRKALTFTNSTPSDLSLEHFNTVYEQDLRQENHCGLDERLFLDDDPTVTLPAHAPQEVDAQDSEDSIPLGDGHTGYESPPEEGTIPFARPNSPRAAVHMAPKRPQAASRLQLHPTPTPPSPIRQSLNASKQFRSMLRETDDHPSLELAAKLVACDASRPPSADTCQEITALIQRCSGRFVAGYMSECGEESLSLGKHIASQGRRLTWRLLQVLCDFELLHHTSLKRVAIVRAVVALAFEAILASCQWDTATTSRLTLGNMAGHSQSIAFPWILTVVETSAFHVLKTIEPSIAACFCEFPFLVNHFHLLEQSILQQHLWAIGSDLIASLRHQSRSLPIIDAQACLGSFLDGRPPRKRALFGEADQDSFLHPQTLDNDDDDDGTEALPDSTQDDGLKSPTVEPLPAHIARLSSDPTGPRGPILIRAPSQVPEKSLQLLVRKLFPYTATRVQQLCGACDLSNCKLLAQLTWTVIHHIFTQNVSLLEGLSLDQLILCAAYGSTKHQDSVCRLCDGWKFMAHCLTTTPTEFKWHL
eukprot:m.261711 g.261711  ORF g.261711 m.261711 type:complete len:802 (+) comp17603_c0_seq3:285-2690(+)